MLLKWSRLALHRHPLKWALAARAAPTIWAMYARNINFTSTGFCCFTQKHKQKKQNKKTFYVCKVLCYITPSHIRKSPSVHWHLFQTQGEVSASWFSPHTLKSVTSRQANWSAGKACCFSHISSHIRNKSVATPTDLFIMVIFGT